MNRDPDQLIRDAVLQEDANADSVLDDRPLTEDIVQAFRGRRRWMTIFPMVMTLAYTVLAVWCGYKFFQEEATKLQIAWASGVVCSFLSICTTKVWIWGEWRRSSIIRELKRLELKVDRHNRRAAE